MGNAITINGINIWQTYGVRLCKGAYEALLTPAPTKSTISNNVRNENGERVLCGSIGKIDKRTVSFSVFIEGGSMSEYLANYNGFMALLTSGMIELNVPALNIPNTNMNGVYRLTYNSCTKYGDYGLRRGKFTLSFTEPNPTNRT